MGILLVNFFLCVLYILMAWFCRIWLSSRKLDKFFVVIIFINIVIVHSIIDPFSVPDLPVYYDMFIGIKNVEIIDLFTLKRLYQSDIEPGYLLLVKIISFVSNEFTIFLFCVSIIILSSYFFIINKYSPYVFVSIIMLLLTTFNQSIFVLRQHLAIAICLLSLPSIIDKKQIKFLLIVIVASLFHRTALVFLPLYYLYWIRNYKLLIGALVGGGFLILIVKDIVFNYINNTISRYSSYEIEGYNSIVNFLIPLVLFIFMLIFIKKDSFKDGINRLLTCSLLIALVYCGTTMEYSGMARLMLYYNAVYLLVIPVTMNYIRNNKLKYLFAISSIVLFFIESFFTDSISYLKDLRLLF